jgi:hypothetical protein
MRNASLCLLAFNSAKLFVALCASMCLCGKSSTKTLQINKEFRIARNLKLQTSNFKHARQARAPLVRAAQH